MAMVKIIVKNIFDKVDLFAPMLQQSIITDDFYQEYLTVNSIQTNAPIKFSNKSANNFYIDLNESRFIVRAKIPKANETDMDNNV